MQKLCKSKCFGTLFLASDKTRTWTTNKCIDTRNDDNDDKSLFASLSLAICLSCCWFGRCWILICFVFCHFLRFWHCSCSSHMTFSIVPDCVDGSSFITSNQTGTISRLPELLVCQHEFTCSVFTVIT